MKILNYDLSLFGRHLEPRQALRLSVACQFNFSKGNFCDFGTVKKKSSEPFNATTSLDLSSRTLNWHWTF